MENKNISDEKKKIQTIAFEKISDGLIGIIYKNLGDTNLDYTRNDITHFISNKDVKSLRKVSRYFFGHSGLYKRLILHMAYMLTYDYLVLPAKQTYTRLSDKRFQDNFDKALNYIDDLYIKDTFSKIGEQVFVNGAFYGYLRELGDTKAIQELPIDFCRTRAKIDGVYQVQFDVRFFDMFRNPEDKKKVINQYPEEFLEYYLLYKEGKLTGSEPYYVDLNQEYAMCFQFDDIGVPFFCGIFEDLVELEEYKLLEKDKAKLDLKKLVVQKLPMDDETGEVLIELPDAQALHTNLVKMLQNNAYVDGISSPCEIEALNLQENSNVTQKDNLLTAERTLFNDAGVSQSILNATGNLSLTISVQNDSAVSFRLLDMFKRWLDNRLNYLIPSGNYSFEVFFPPVTIYNRKEIVDMYTTQATYGYAKLLPPVCAGIKQSTLINMIHLENHLGLDTLLKPLMSSNTMPADGGRPASDETKLDEAGTETKNRGSNGGRA